MPGKVEVEKTVQEQIKVTAMVIMAQPVGEYDRRVVLLTKERGKITAFARGARRQTSKLQATTDLFVFGEFTLYPGRNSYTLTEVRVSSYFEELRKDFVKAYYGMFLLELCDYYGRENNDEKELLKLLYQSLKALQQTSIPPRLIQYIAEIRSLVIAGEYPGIPMKMRLSQSTVYTIHYIAETPIEKLFTFMVKEEVLDELGRVAKIYRDKFIDRKLKSLEMLSILD